MQYITDTESEQRVLSGMLHSDTACVESLNTLSADDFSVPTHATLYTLSRSIYRKGAKPTYAELVREMMDLYILLEWVWQQPTDADVSLYEQRLARFEKRWKIAKI